MVDGLLQDVTPLLCLVSYRALRRGLVLTLWMAHPRAAKVSDQASAPKRRDSPQQHAVRVVKVDRFPQPIASPKLVHPETLCGHDALQSGQQDGYRSWCGGVANQERKEVGQQSDSVQVGKHLRCHAPLSLTSQNTASQRHHHADIERQATKPQGPEESVEPLEEAVLRGWREPSEERGVTGHVGSLEDGLRGLGRANQVEGFANPG